MSNVVLDKGVKLFLNDDCVAILADLRPCEASEDPRRCLMVLTETELLYGLRVGVNLVTHYLVVEFNHSVGMDFEFLAPEAALDRVGDRLA